MHTARICRYENFSKQKQAAELSWAEQNIFSVSTVSAGVGTWTVWKQQLSYNADNVWGALNQAAAYCTAVRQCMHVAAAVVLQYYVKAAHCTG